jgi:1-pyrroline-5-carboxylate dehydrogenase
VVGDEIVHNPDVAGLTFTGSYDVGMDIYKNFAKDFPKPVICEMGGKNPAIVTAKADLDKATDGVLRSAFGYQGQKCSAASRAYVAKSVWDAMKDELGDTIASLKVGDVSDFSNFMGAVIKKGAFDKHTAAIAEARDTKGMKVFAGGKTDDREGYFVHPTLLTTENPMVRHMQDEFFGPIVTLHVYPDQAWNETLQLVDRTSPYALTGAVFARDRGAIVQAMSELRNAAGNFYINDKPTGAVVGQQPFGGARASGTDDKAGSPLNLLRWTAARTIKETFVPPTDHRYPFLSEP